MSAYLEHTLIMMPQRHNNPFKIRLRIENLLFERNLLYLDKQPNYPKTFFGAKKYDIFAKIDPLIVKIG